MYTYILFCFAQSVNTWMYILGVEHPMPPKPVSAPKNPAYDPNAIRIRYLGYCHLEMVHLRPISKHHDKGTYHVLQRCSICWLLPECSGSRLRRSTLGMLELLHLAIESTQKALARSLSARRSPYLHAGGRQPALSCAAEPIVALAFLRCARSRTPARC